MVAVGTCAAVLAGPASAAFPGLNGSIALSRNDQIVVKAPGDLAGGTALTTLGQNQDPEWSPDGTRIAFVSNRLGGVFDVWVMNADGTGQTRITQESGDAEAPSWSPDGGRIAYDTTALGGDKDVAVIAVGGGGRLVVAGGSGDQSLPVWSPDGARIVFQDTTVGGLSSVGPTGAGRAPFLSDAAQPDFSPDGSRLVVRRTDAERLQVVNADGSGGLRSWRTSRPPGRSGLRTAAVSPITASSVAGSTASSPLHRPAAAPRPRRPPPTGWTSHPTGSRSDRCRLSRACRSRSSPAPPARR